MSDTLPSKTLSIPDGELWSLVRSLISQGTYIQMDATAGKYKHSEEFFARIDEAARERAEEILTKYSAPEPEPARKCHHMFDVLVITTAYESGFGHGLQKDNLRNPYSEGSYEYHAYTLGYDEGASRAAPPPSAVLVNAFRAGAFYGCAEEFNPLDLQRDAEAYGSRHSPTKSGEV
jgi:hypothetical protein